MKAVLVEGYMETARFNMPNWCGKREISYPLPPFSTVIGMVHSLCRWKGYHPMYISVSGTGRYYTSVEIRRTGGKWVSDETADFVARFPLRAKSGDGYVGYVDYPALMTAVEDLYLRLHIAPQDGEDLEAVYQVLRFPPVYPSLGKNDELIRIDSVSVVSISDTEEEAVLGMDAYGEWDACVGEGGKHAGYAGTCYKLNKDYRVCRGRRIFNKVTAAHLGKGMRVKARCDELGNPVFFF